MQRVAFQLRVRLDKIDEYEAAHQRVWPELLAELASCGVSDYSIFRRGQQLFLYLHVPDFDMLLLHLKTSDVDRRWQEQMSSLLEPVPDLLEGEPFAMMREVFFFRGGPAAVQPQSSGNKES